MKSPDIGDFLYELFCYGCRKKFENIPLTDITEDHFNVVRGYIRAVGADAILMGYTRNDAGEVIDIKVGFNPYYWRNILIKIN